MSQIISSGGARIKSIQRGTITITGATSNTALITAVNTANSILRLLGITSSTALNDNQAYARLVLTDSTTITAFVNTSPGASSVVASFEIVEYWPGAIKSIQRNTIALAGANSATAAITPVDITKTELHTLGFTSSNASANSTVLTRFTLTDATTVTATSPGTAANQTGGFQAVEWY